LVTREAWAMASRWPGSCVVACDQSGRLPRGVVREAKDRDVGAVQRFGARRLVLAPSGIDGDELDVGPRGQPLADLQTRGAHLAIDEDLCGHVGPPGPKSSSFEARCAGASG
jgi:hypothetical protein